MLILLLLPSLTPCSVHPNPVYTPQAPSHSTPLPPHKALRLPLPSPPLHSATPFPLLKCWSGLLLLWAGAPHKCVGYSTLLCISSLLPKSFQNGFPLDCHQGCPLRLIRLGHRISATSAILQEPQLLWDCFWLLECHHNWETSAGYPKPQCAMHIGLHY